MAGISRDDVAHVARLARLDLTDDELERFTGQLAAVLDHAADVAALDTAGVPPTAHPFPLVNVLRDDVPGPASTATRCWPWPRRPRTAGSGCRDPRGGAVTATVALTALPAYCSLAERGCRRDATDIAAAVRAGERSAVDVVEEHLAAIGAREGELHAFNLVLADEARAAADEIDRRVAAGEDPGPLAGVPVALKDNLCTRGIPTTCSSRILEGWRPPYDATVVDRLRAAGAVIVGKTNLDEFAMGSSTENSAFGPTRNPHDTSRVPGRVERRQRGGGGGRLRGPRARLRHRRLDPPAGGAVRRRRREAHLRAVSRYGLVAFASSLDQIGPFAADGGRRRPAPGGHRRPRPDGLDVDPRAGAGATSRARRRRRGPSDRRGAGFVEAVDPEVAARVTAAATALEAAGAKVDEASVPATASACRRTT